MKSQIVNISLPKKLLKMSDLVAREEFRTRSDLFREAIRSYITRKLTLKSVFAYGEKQGKKSKIKETDIEKLVHEYRQGQ